MDVTNVSLKLLCENFSQSIFSEFYADLMKLSSFSINRLWALMPLLHIFSFLSCLALSACTNSSNEPIARYQKITEGYEIRLTGHREKMSHDLIGSIFPHMYVVEEIFIVPRLKGIVDGGEIPTVKGNYRYSGVMRFNDETMIVDLRYVDTDRKVERDISWNGIYKLVPVN